MAHFTIYTLPQGKARARTVIQGGKIHSYTPEKTMVFESEVTAAYKAQCGEFFDKIGEIKYPLEVEINAYFPIPKSFSKAKRAAAEENVIRPTGKPDCDNIAKAVCDALNNVAYRDDSQIVALAVQKWYTTEKTRLEVTVKKGG